MRVVCNIRTPHPGNKGMAQHIIPMIEMENVGNTIIRIVSAYQHYRPGMELNFRIEEDWK